MANNPNPSEPLRPDMLSQMLAKTYGCCDLCDEPLSPTLEGEFPGKRITVLTCTGCGAIADLPEPPRIG